MLFPSNSTTYCFDSSRQFSLLAASPQGKSVRHTILLFTSELPPSGSLTTTIDPGTGCRALSLSLRLTRIKTSAGLTARLKNIWTMALRGAVTPSAGLEAITENGLGAYTFGVRLPSGIKTPFFSKIMPTPTTPITINTKQMINSLGEDGTGFNESIVRHLRQPKNVSTKPTTITMKKMMMAGMVI